MLVDDEQIARLLCGLYQVWFAVAWDYCEGSGVSLFVFLPRLKDGGFQRFMRFFYDWVAAGLGGERSLMPHPSPLTPEETFMAAVSLLHGLEIEESDVEDLYADWAARDQAYQRIAYNAKNSRVHSLLIYDIKAGKVLTVVSSTVLGFFSGGFVGAAIGFVAGILKSFVFSPGGQENAEDENFNQQQGFENGGKLAPFGSLLPAIYGSRSIDPNGGVRVGGILIHSRIETELGTNTLYQLYALGVGESALTGWGQIGLINDAETLFNNQPRQNFNATEITTFSRNGTQLQTAIAEFPFYSQALSPPDYAVFGVDLRGRVDDIVNLGQNNVNAVNVTFVGNAVTKTAGVDGVYDAGFFSTVGVNRGGSLQFTAGQVGTSRAIGLSNTDIDQDFTSIEYGWTFNAAGAFITENGNVQLGPIAYVATDIFRIEIDNFTNQIRYAINGQRLYTSAIAPTPPLFVDAAFQTLGATLTNIISSAEPGGIVPTVGAQTTFTVDDDEIALFDPSEEYSLCDGQIGSTATTFRIIAKDLAASTVTADANLTLAAGSQIYAYWTAKYENTKRVTRTDFNLSFRVNARDAEDGDLAVHAVGFDLWMRDTTTAPGTEQFIIRFHVRSKNPSVIRRGFRVINQPLGRYYYEFRPMCDAFCDRVGYELVDTGVFQNVVTNVALAGAPITISGELTEIINPASPNFDDQCDELRRRFSYDDKIQVSSEQGPTGRISSINEIVEPAVINNPVGGAPNPYPGIPLQGYRFLASERLQQPPGTRTFVEEARICPNLMSAGSASVLSTATVLNDPTADFNVDGVLVGMVIRNLTQASETQVAAVTQTTITTTAPLNWSEKDRYVVWVLASTAYFPDVYADEIANDAGGIRTLVDSDEYVDYPSIVRSRQFCVANNYYWNGRIDRGIPFVQWATSEAVGSRLFPIKIDGRWGLTPDELTPVEHIFNASNSRNAKEEWVDWQTTITNRLIVVYTDGRDLFTQDGIRFREKTITISTADAFNGIEPPHEETLTLKNVSGPDQATAIGATYLKSQRQQNRGIQFETSYQAAFLQAGQLIRFQHPLLETDEAFSGFVLEADAIAAGVQRVKLDCQPKLSEGYATGAAANGVVDVNADFTETAVVVGDLLLNTTTGQNAIITAVAANQLTAAIAFAERDNYCVLNLTPPVDLFASVTFREDDTSQDDLSFLFVQVGDEVWLEISGLAQPLVRLDSVNIGGVEYLYRVQSVQPDGKALFSVSATFHPGAELYDLTGLVVQRDDEIVVG